MTLRLLRQFRGLRRRLPGVMFYSRSTVGTVLDPFVGSGTTMIAALESGRHAIGIDLKDKYCQFTRKRIEKEFGSLIPERKRA